MSSEKIFPPKLPSPVKKEVVEEKKGFFQSLFSKKNSKKEINEDESNLKKISSDSLEKVGSDINLKSEKNNLKEELILEDDKDKNINKEEKNKDVRIDDKTESKEEIKNFNREEKQIISKEKRTEKEEENPKSDFLESNKDKKSNQDEKNKESNNWTVSHDEVSKFDKEIPLPPVEIINKSSDKKEISTEKESSFNEMEKDFQWLVDHSNSQSHSINFFLKKGIKVETISDLLKYVESLSDKEIENNIDNNSFIDWLSLHYYNNSFVERVSKVKDKSNLIKHLKQEISENSENKNLLEKKEFSEEKTEDKKIIKKEDIKKHFDDLASSNEEIKGELEKIVSSKSSLGYSKSKKEKNENRIDSKSLKLFLDSNKHDKEKIKSIICSFDDLNKAINLTDGSDFKKVLIEKKSDLLDFINYLSILSAHISSLRPFKLKEDFLNIISSRFSEQKNILESFEAKFLKQANEFIIHEDELENKQKFLDEYKSKLFNREKKLHESENFFSKRVNEHEDDLASYQAKTLSFLDEYKKKMFDLKEKTVNFDKILSIKKSELEGEWNAKLSSLEKDKAKFEIEKEKFENKIKSVEDEIEKRVQKVKEKEDLLNKKILSFSKEKDNFLELEDEKESELVKRESLVQKGVDKMIELDKEVIKERENLIHLKKEAEEAGFKSYLKASLKGVNSDLPIISSAPNPFAEDSKILDLIRTCNDAIESKSFNDAKKIYEDLQKIYNDDKSLKKHQKELLFDALQEIYTSLHLAMLEK